MTVGATPNLVITNRKVTPIAIVNANCLISFVFVVSATAILPNFAILRISC